VTKAKKTGFSVFKRTDGRFVLAYQVASGQWKQHVLEAKEERDATREAKRWLAQQDAAGNLGAKPKTKLIGSLWREWIDNRTVMPGIALSTVRDNESHFERDLVPFHSVAIGDLDPQKIRDFLRTFREGRSASKVRNVISTLASFYSDARAEGWVTSTENVVRHPAVSKELPSVKTHAQPVYMQIEDAQRVSSAPTTPMFRQVKYVVAFLSGLREGELQGLQWKDIHLTDEVPYLRVDRAFAMKASDDHYAALTVTKTEGSVRSVPLHPASVVALTWWRDEGWEFFVGRKHDPDDAVFASKFGIHSRPKSARDLRDDLEASGLPIALNGEPFTIQATRRSFSTWLADAGVEDATIGMLLGHAGKSTATRHYTAPVLRRLASAVALLSFRWQDPRHLPSSSRAQCVRCAGHMSQNESGYNRPNLFRFKSALVAQWIEQRFPNSLDEQPLPQFSARWHNVAVMDGAKRSGVRDANGQFASRRPAEERQRLASREAHLRVRQDQVIQLIEEGKRIALGETEMPIGQRREYVFSLIHRASELLALGGRAP